jgi:hypothetical protein
MKMTRGPLIQVAGRSLLARRTVLRAGGAAFALPLLEAMSPVGARRTRAAGVGPKRFVVMFSPNGTIYKNWVPTQGPGGETDFTFGPILEPLAAHKADTIVVSGLNQQGGGGDGHQNGIGGMLTGQTLNPGPFAGGAGAGSSGWPNGISIDQRVAEMNGRGTRLRSLELGVQVGTANNTSRMSFLGPNRPVPPEENPARAYERLFMDSGATPEQVARLRARRRSVISAVKDQFTAVSSRVGSADRARLDAHATMVMEIEARLDAQSMPTTACGAHSAPAVPADVAANDSFPAVGRLQTDILALALACDITRVASLQWSRSVSITRFTWLQINEAHHELSHLPDSDTATVDKLTSINRWYAGELAHLCDRLAEAKEVDGSRLLDSSLVLWVNELGKGNTHSRKQAPYVLVGRAGGALRTGRHLSFTGDPPHNDLLVSVLLAMDIPATTFGKAEWCRGPLPGLL